MGFVMPRARTRVEIQEATQTRGTSGGVVLTWATKKVKWMHVVPLSGNELIRMQQLQSEVTHKCRARYDSSMNTAQRIKIGERIIEIKSVINVNSRNRWMELLCKETT